MEKEKSRIIINGNAFYELDLECLRKKEEERKEQEEKKKGKGAVGK